MNTQKGKITFMSLIAFCILALAALMAFKYLANGVEKREIKKEIFDTMGVYRGVMLTEDKVREIVVQVLNKRSLQPLEIYADFSRKGKIVFSYKYEVSVNYLLFTRKELVEINGEMEN